jgi:hypothetical protein
MLHCQGHRFGGNFVFFGCFLVAFGFCVVDSLSNPTVVIDQMVPQSTRW